MKRNISGSKDYHGYEVFYDGTIINKHGKKMKVHKSSTGTYVVSLRIDKVRMTIPVDRILYQAFHPKEDLTSCRVLSHLDHDYEISNGWSTEPIFDVNDLYLCKLNHEKKKSKTIRVERKELENILQLLIHNSDMSYEIVTQRIERILERKKIDGYRKSI